MGNPRVVWWLIVVALFAAACGESTDEIGTGTEREPVEEADREEVVAEIKDLLTEIESAYASGDAKRAAELSAEAYLENYEVIEAEVIEQAPEVNEQLEPLLGAELRKRITEGASVKEIESMIARARALLTKALRELGGSES